ncbi:unnamed protein product [Echinostoma caproni]|uniref:BPI1 domain-containing protein n=1 Tax=Echinostoma caproni TaxID=27848 RepID=A0A183AC58_9TREM|nr:unnamed protein product [Echinostoma caproni]
MGRYNYFLLPLFLLTHIESSHLQAIALDEDKPAETKDAQKSEALCLDFLGILIDHMVRRITVHMDEPKVLEPISNSFFTLTDGRLYGLKNIVRTCPIELAHEEMWLQSAKPTPNQDVHLTEWIQKRDTKLGDVLRLSFCLGIPHNLQLRGSMAVTTFWSTYDPEGVRITLSDISIRATLQLQLNMTGKMRLSIAGMRVEKFGSIRFEPEATGSGSGDEEERTNNGFMSQYASLADWLANGPLYTPLVIILETIMNDSFSALLKEKQPDL